MMDDGEQFAVISLIFLTLSTNCYIVSFLTCFAYSVVCRQLGFRGANRVYRHDLLRGGSTSLPIWLDRVQCTSENQYLSDCSHNGWGNTNCGHNLDVGVECAHTGSLFSYCNALK